MSILPSTLLEDVIAYYQQQGYQESLSFNHHFYNGTALLLHPILDAYAVYICPFSDHIGYVFAISDEHTKGIYIR
jgi:hypothetical protein